MNRCTYCIALPLLVAALLVAVSGCVTTGQGGAAPEKGSVEWRLSSLEGNLQDTREAQLAQQAALEERVARLEREVRDLEAARIGDSASERALADQAAAKDYAVSPPPNDPKRPGAPANRAPSLYARALDLTRSGKAREGRKLFQRFLDEEPKSSYVPNALYWMGETYYREGDYARAILSFKEVTARFPDNDKTPASLLKMGYAYEHLGDMDNATFYLETLVKSYPESEPAGLARKRLANLGR